MNIRCRNCGGETPDHARYCIRCGADTDAIALPRDTMTYMAADDGESPVYTNFGGAIRLFFKNYFNFSGRSTRSEYWYAYLFILLANAGLEIAERMSGLTILKLIWDLAIFIPLMSAGFRRLHDSGRSGAVCVVSMAVALFWAALSGVIAGGSHSGGILMFWLLLTITILILAVYLIILLCKPSLINHNPYGRDPF